VKALLIEDEKTLAYEIEAFLKKAFYICDLAHNARQGFEKLEDTQYDFVLLDLGLPDRDGFVLLEKGKKAHPETAFIIITARGNVDDRVRGLNMGADDYLTKPFSLLELEARMQAISRRKSGINTQLIDLGEFKVDIQKRMVSSGDVDIDLTRKEFDVLSYLLLHKNRVLTRLQLSEHIWGSFADDDFDSNYIDVHIKNLRKKLGAHAGVEWLETVRGVGYRIRK
jgi:DNA-binding response OmpR family regulator